jgi:hypothetical protein
VGDVEGLKPFDPATESQNLHTYGDAAEAFKSRARPLYKAMDAANGYNGELEKVNDAWEKVNDAWEKAVRTGDTKESDRLEAQMDEMLDNAPDSIPAETQNAARTLWRQGKIYERLHGIVEPSFAGPPQDYAGAPGVSKRVLKAGNAEGGTLETRLKRYFQNPQRQAEVEGTIGKEGVQNLLRASNLVSKPELAQAAATIAERVGDQIPLPKNPGKAPAAPTVDTPEPVTNAGVAKELAKTVLRAGGKRTIPAAVGGLAAHAMGQPAMYGEIGGIALSEGGRYVMNQMVTNPRIGKMMDYAVQHGITPERAAKSIAALITAGRDAKEKPAQ